MLNYIKKKHYFIFQFLKRLKSRPYFLGVDFFICYVYSLIITNKLFGFSYFPRVFFESNMFRVVVKKMTGSKVISREKIAILFESFAHGGGRTVFICGEYSTIEIKSTFTIGDGCSILLLANSKLTLSGKSSNDKSGITSDTKIICAKEIIIGYDVIISWGCYISDTSNHYINSVINVSPVHISRHVWISEGCTIGPGTFLGEGCVVGSKSYVNRSFPKNILLAGCPAIVKKENITWQR